MNDQPTTLDPILEARLDLLEQALDEAQAIRAARADQAERLDALAKFLRPGGDLSRLGDRLQTGVQDALTRLNIALRSLESLEQDEPERAVELEDMINVAALKEAAVLVGDLRKQIDKEWEPTRREAYVRFSGLEDWSVAALEQERLEEAVATYENALWEIKGSAAPWATYEEQLRNRERSLFHAYFQVVGSMAVRGFRVVDALADDRRSLLRILLKPLDAGGGQEPPELPPPNLLTRSEHVQLGYLRWNLWAMPLLGRAAGLHLIEHNTFRSMQIAPVHKVICADTYAAHVLGPSYVAAALFLDLDPDGTSIGGSPSDPVRAALLLELLPELAAAPQREAMERFAALLRDAWSRARGAIGAPDFNVSDEVREVTAKFRSAVEQKFPDGGYDLGNLAARMSEAESFARGGRAGAGLPRDVLMSMWWARVNDLADCQTIDRSARTSMTQTSGSSATATQAKKTSTTGVVRVKP